MTIPKPKEQSIPAAGNLGKASLLLALLGLSLYSTKFIEAILAALSPHGAVWEQLLKWSVVGLLGLLNGVLLVALDILAHEAVHRVLVRSAFWNELWGGVCAALLLVPFNANRQFHLAHHRYTHQPGRDPESILFGRPFWAALTIGSVMGLGEQYRILATNILGMGERSAVRRAVLDVVFLAVIGTTYFVLLPALGISLTLAVFPAIALTPLVFAFRGISDHYGLPAIVGEAGQQSDALDVPETIESAARLGRQPKIIARVVLTSFWLEWLWSHFNYHEIHHRYPYLSHRYLPQVFMATRHQHPYVVVRGYGRSLLNLRKCSYFQNRP
jgi:fatty acid desaturase